MPRRHCPGVGGRGSGGQRAAGGRSAGGGRVAGGPLRANGRLLRAYRHPEQVEEKTFLRRIPLRTLADGRLALRVVPGTLWDRLLLSGVRAEIWMQPGVNRAHLDRYAARAYDIPPAARQGKLALVLGAGNVASIAPLDVLHKLFIENQVCLLKLNPVNDYLHDLLARPRRR